MEGVRVGAVSVRGCPPFRGSLVPPGGQHALAVASASASASSPGPPAAGGARGAAPGAPHPNLSQEGGGGC